MIKYIKDFILKENRFNVFFTKIKSCRWYYA